MKKLLVSLIVITVLAACGDNSTSSTEVKKDSISTGTSVDTSKMRDMSTDTSMHKMDSSMNKMDTSHK